MGTFFLTLDASAVYTTDAPVLNVLVDGVVVSSISITSSYGLSSYSFEYAGTYPGTLSFSFNDGSAELGRSVIINNAYINGTNVNANLNISVLTQGQIANLSTAGIANLFTQTELILADLDAVTIQGDNLTNKLVGTTGIDVIDGAEDNDNIKGFDGNDQLHGGAGNDIIRGGIGDDIILGADGNDILKGEDGNDILVGGIGTDLLDGGAGDDILNSGADSDTIRAGAGADIAFGGDGNDRLFGDDGDDLLDGGADNDLIEGGIGNDTLMGGTGMDLLRGEDGNDHLDGGDDNDQIYGGAGNDIAYGGDGWDRVEGNDGDDTLYGGLGSDTVLGGAGVDTVYGDDGNDRVRGGDGNDFVYGGEGNDQVFGDAGDDIVYGGNGNDLVNGNEGNDILYGEAGLDKIFGHEGNDTIYGGDDNDRIYGNQGNDIINGDAGDDKLYASSIHEVVTTSSFITTPIFFEDFATGSGAFTYSDGGFGGSDPGNPNNIYGQYYTGSGAGSVYVYNNPPNNNSRTNVSGSWDATFTVTELSTNVTLSLDYILYHAAANDAGEDARIYIEIDGVRYGAGGNDFIAEALGSGGATNTGIVPITLNLSDLSVGVHTISMGLFKTAHNRSDEGSYVIFDNINIEGDQEEIYTGLNIMDEGSVNIVNGGDGNDKIYGSSGNDTLNGDAGDDEIYSGTTAILADAIANFLVLNPAVAYNEATNSFYQYVTGTISHTDAEAAANTATLNGLTTAGHLAVLDNVAEQAFVGTLVNGGNWAWVSGSDTATEGVLVYDDGPNAGSTLDASLNWYNGSSASTNQDARDNVIIWDGGGDTLYVWADTSNASGYVIEWDATELINSIGSNTLNGGTGADDLYGSTGREIFVFDNTDSVDDIFNFDTLTDAIDIKDVISYTEGVDTLSDFVQVTTVGGNTEIAVDTDGALNGANFTTIASIDGVTGLDLTSLVAGDNLIVA